MSKKKNSRNKKFSGLVANVKPVNSVMNANLITQALQYHEQNQLESALKLYKQVLKNEPKNTVALQYVGLIAHLQGDNAKGIRLMQKALTLDPEYSVCASNLARILYKLGDFQQAKTYNQQAIACDAQNEDAISNLGKIYLRENESSLAEVQFQQALNLNSQNIEALNGLGDIATETQAWQRATEFYQRSLQADDKNVDTYNHFGILYLLQHDYSQAETYFQAGLKLDPKHIATLCNLSKVFTEQKQFNQALNYLNQALKLDPKHIATLCNLSKVFIEQQQFTTANKYLQQALQINSKHIDVQVGLGILAAATGEVDKAWKYYQTALQINPKHVATQYNLAHTELKLGNYQTGFALYETRTQQFAADYQTIHKFPQAKLWQGENINQQTLLVCWEQGFGDGIQFARYLNLLSSQCNKIVFWCQESLAELFTASFPAITVIANTQPMPTYDKYVFLLSLPHLFATEVATIPNNMPYLIPTTKTVANLEFNPKKLNVGLVWAGNKDYSNDINRSIQLKPLLPLLNTAQSQFYSLQIGENSQDITDLNMKDKIIDCSPMINDFADTARIIQQLDLVISIDSGVAHLTGALNKPVWLCLPLVADWRWLENRTDSPWYPSARLFRQTIRQNWNPVITDLQLALITAVKLKLT